MTVSNEILELLATSFPGFRALSLMSCDGFRTDGLKAIATHCRDEYKRPTSDKVITEVDKWMGRFDCLVIGPDDIRLFTPPRKTAEHSGFDSQFDGMCCKAGNRVCKSLSATEDSVSDVMFCDICCSEPGFCRDDCRILCCKTIKMAFGGYSYFPRLATSNGKLSTLMT
ncbi:unnamed protein product [Fraxinus pennsylvanica]|uniref:Uncharacterized protein n=1 Tax=Fraxinus pennsylvanica TaxID=56036 RepID=A0AAD1ZIY1_9LAMI|nr:unnamed protein product [Fraxinus pennsylvanica]